MKNIAIFAKVHDPRCQVVAGELVKWLEQRELVPLIEAHLARHLGRGPGLDRDDIPDRADLVVVLGGDGTLISVARLIGDRGLPILGVNLGSLGFLTEITVEEMYDVLDNCLTGSFGLSPRMMLTAKIIRDGELFGEYRALNDVVINKGAVARIIDIETLVDGAYLTTFKSDGLIISSPTGSTGYSLSAQGPIIYPELNCLVITPICPHTLTNRPIVISGNAEVSAIIKTQNEDVLLTLDGQVGVELRYGDVIQVAQAENRSCLIQSKSRDFFEVLRTKLKWGER